MKPSRIRRIGVTLILLVLLLLIFPATPALAEEVIDPVPKRGVVGRLVDVYGAGFTASLITIYFTSDVATTTYLIDNQVDAYEKVATVNATSGGEFSAYFNVPSVLNDGSVTRSVGGGTYYIIAAYGTSKPIQAVYEFTVEVVAAATLSPTSGKVGDSLTVNGVGFGASRSIAITFGGSAVVTTASDSSGGFSASFPVPEKPAGSHQVSVTDGTSTRTQNFTVSPNTSFTPTSGGVDTEVTVSGTGFGASQAITLTFDGSAIATTSTDANGSFSAVALIPEHGSGSYQLIASDGTNAGSSSFTISPVADITPASGFVGTEVTVSGTGFAASKSLPVLFDGDLVSTNNTDTKGNFTGSFVVPASNAGSYTVQVSNEDDLIEAGDFSISTSATINPVTSAASPGHLGSQLTVSGVGYTEGRTVTVTYDGTGVATAVVKSDGTFQTTFTVTAGSGGEHAIIASDAINTSQFKFYMEATPPSVPSPLKPEMGIEAEAETVFDWQDANDPSGVTYHLQVATSEDFSLSSIVLEKKGLTSSEYTLTELERLKALEDDAPYYWRVKAIDGASNESQWSGTGTFLIKGFSLSMSQPLMYILIGVGALLLFLGGLWLGRRTAYY